MFSGSNKLLRIEPAEFRFVFVKNRPISCSVQLTNKTDYYIAFKIKAKVPHHRNYHLANTGIVPPRSTHDYIVTLREQSEVPQDSTNMFFMQSAVVTEQTTLKEITRDKFEKNSGNVVDEVWLKAVHVQPALPSPPVRKGTQVGSSSRPLRSDGENINYMLSGSNELLRIEPTEFRFAFEKNKSISCSIQLTNITDNYIAFKIKAKVPDHMNYHLSNTGIVPPRSTHDYIVTLKAQSEVPPDCNKMFFMQCAMVTEGTTLKEITKDKFQRNSGKVVDELWLKAVHAQHPPPQPPVRKGSQEGSSSHHLQSDGGNINYSKDFFTPTESTLHSVPLQHLKDITNNFCDERQIGRGGFGVVYKGVLGNGNVIAVKKFLQSIMWSSEKQFENEINLLRQLEHRNIVRLLGFCYETKHVQKLHEGKFILVWNIECLICLEYLSKGSLNMYISDASSGLDWPQRLKIIQGVSYGLQYLHQQSGGPIIHLDLKPGNILGRLPVPPDPPPRRQPLALPPMDLPPLSHQALFAAVRSADAAAVRRLLDDAGASGSTAPLVAAQTEAGESALYVAAEAGALEVVSLLLPLYDLEAATLRSRLDLDAFHVAAKQGHTEVVKEFLGRWPELCSVCDSSNTSPLYSAAVKDHLDVVNAILDTDDNCLRIVRKNGKTALHTTVRIGYHRIVKALIERDPGIVPIRDRKGQTALHMAVKGKNTDVVEELLMADVSILNVRDKKANTALHIATRKWRPQMVQLLLSYETLEVNAINNHNETAMDLAEKVPYGESKMEIIEWLTEAGAKNAVNVGKVDEASELRRTVSDIKHNVQAQLNENAKTNKRVTGIAKELRKLHREAVQNTINSVTLVAILIASIAFVSIFNLPGQYYQDTKDGGEIGEAYISKLTGFRVFCLLNAIALFISLAVVVVQITLVAWETGAQKQIIKIVNKLMWSACLSTCAAFVSLAYVVVGPQHAWMAFTISAVGGPIMIGTLLFLAYLLLRPRFKFGEDRQRRIRRASGSKSFSWSMREGLSDLEAVEDHEKKIYAL